MSYGLEEIGVIQAEVRELLEQYPHLNDTALVVEAATQRDFAVQKMTNGLAIVRAKVD